MDEPKYIIARTHVGGICHLLKVEVIGEIKPSGKGFMDGNEQFFFTERQMVAKEMLKAQGVRSPLIDPRERVRLHYWPEFSNLPPY